MVARIGGELVPNSGPALIVDQGRLLTGVEFTLVRYVAGVNWVREQCIEMTARERFAAALGAIRCRAAFRAKPETVGLLLDPAHAAVLTIEREDAAHRLGLRVEQLDQPGKIGERPGQPVDLVDDHDVDPAGPGIGDQVLQGGSLQIATGETAIVVAGFDQYPALVALAADEGLAGFALRGERVEFLLQSFLGGFAGVDRAAPAVGVTPRHCCSPSRRRSGTLVARSGDQQAGSASTRRRAAPTTACR